MKIPNIQHILKTAKLSWIRKPIPKDCHNYWKNPGDYGNTPLGHAGLDDTISHSILMNSEISNLKLKRDSSILEIGCNCGKNLNYLYKNGFKNLSGIEINKNAIKLMKEIFKELYYNSNIKVDTLEDSLKKIDSDSYDVVFSLTVLMHIHSDSDFILDELTRITKKYLITWEDEYGKGWTHYPRNYKKVFESRGFKQIKEFTTPKILPNHVFRIFEK